MQGGIHPEFTGALPCHDTLFSPSPSNVQCVAACMHASRSTGALLGMLQCKLRVGGCIFFSWLHHASARENVLHL